MNLGFHLSSEIVEVCEEEVDDGVVKEEAVVVEEGGDGAMRAVMIHVFLEENT
jgi:hypothetical protein